MSETPTSTNAMPSRENVVRALRTVQDPEIPVNLYDLGLIYDIAIAADGAVKIQMTLTAPGCPVAGMLVTQTQEAVDKVDGVTAASVELVWDPPWTRDKMSDAAKLALNLDDDEPLPHHAKQQYFDIGRPPRP